MNEEMYKYFCDNNLVIHGIGEIGEKETYYKFESILKYGGLMSKQKLKEEGITVRGKASDLSIDYRITDENQISFFDPTIPKFKDKLLSKHYYYYFPFNPHVIFFIVDRANIKLEQNPISILELNENSGFVSIENFKCIIAPKICVEYLDQVQKKYGFNFPIYDFDFNITNNIDINKRVK